MQQYRVNFPLLIGLMVGTLVSSGGVYALWKFQIDRRSGTLITEAQKAYDAGDYKSATEYYAQYVRIKPDDDEQRVKFAEAHADLAEQFGASIEDRQRAIGILELTLRELPNEEQLRMRVAKLYGKLNLIKDALDHVERIPNDPEAQVLRAAYLTRLGDIDNAIPASFKLIGYNPETDTFDTTKLDDPATYLNLAIMLRGKGEQDDLADRVMQQAVLANPESAQAYLARGRYLYKYGEIERGMEDFEKALQLSPEDADVLFTAAQQAVELEEFEKARGYLEKGKQLHPSDVRFYQIGASIFASQQDWTNALAELDDGLKKIPPPAGFELLVASVDFQLLAKDFSGARKSIEEMRMASLRPEICDWFEAKTLQAEEKWFQANEMFVRLRPLLAADARLSAELNYNLGFTYQQLGQHELAIRAFEDVLKQLPDNPQARIGIQQSSLRIGRESPVANDDPLERTVRQELDKPKAEQNWAAVRAMIDKVAEERELDDTTRELTWGQVLLARQEWAAARTLANELYRTVPEDSRVQTLALNAVRYDPAPDQGPTTALQLMERMNPSDDARWRLFKADLLIMINDERTKPQLASLLTDTEDWSAQQRGALLSGMADRYLGPSLQMYDDARRCMTLVAESQPGDLQTRMRLFNLALDTNDDEGAKAAQDAILKIVGSTNDANWLFAEARRQMWLMRRGRQGSETIGETRKLLARALEVRPEWHELYALSAEVELLANNLSLALKHLDRAEELGRLSPAGVAKHIQLLAADGQLARAAERLNSLPENVRQPLLGDLYAELLFRTKRIDDAVKTAKAQAEANPENAQFQFRYGQLLARSTEQPNTTDAEKKAAIGQAIQAIELAVKLQPDYADAWYSLILFNAMADNQEKAQKALRDIQLSLSGDSLQFVLAKCYEALGRWFDAEPMYRAIYEADPTNIERAQQLAAFYVGPGYRQSDMRDKVAPLINQILRAGADGTIPPSDKNLLWARRTGARLLASSGDYQQLLKAEKMLKSNSQDGSLSLEDRLEMALILAPRPEPESRIMAAQLLEEVDQAQPLNAAASLTLANLYNALGDWSRCQNQMLRAITRNPNYLPLRARYAALLLERGTQQEYTRAGGQIDEIRKLAPTAGETFELGARLFIKTGRQQVIHDYLIKQIPRNADPATISDEMVPMLNLYASLLIELNDLERAEQIHQLLAKRDPNRVFALAQFVGLYRDVARCFDLLEAQFNSDQRAEAVRVGVSVIRARRDEVGDKFDARLEDWMDRALRDNIGSIPLLLAKAEFLEVQQKYTEAIAAYRDLLANPNVVGFGRAVVLNNLSYLMALADAGAATAEVDPLRLVEEAAQILGPTADILDTRAVVYISRKQYDQAIQDLELSVTVNPTPSKYFHLTIAHLRNGQNRAALDSWAKGEALGLNRDSLNRLEHENYEVLKTEIERLRASGA